VSAFRRTIVVRLKPDTTYKRKRSRAILSICSCLPTPRGVRRSATQLCRGWANRLPAAADRSYGGSPKPRRRGEFTSREVEAATKAESARPAL